MANVIKQQAITFQHPILPGKTMRVGMPLGISTQKPASTEDIVKYLTDQQQAIDRMLLAINQQIADIKAQLP